MLVKIKKILLWIVDKPVNALVTVCAILGGVLTYYQLKDRNRSPVERLYDTVDTGTLMPDAIVSSRKTSKDIFRVLPRPPIFHPDKDNEGLQKIEGIILKSNDPIVTLMFGNSALMTDKGMLERGMEIFVPLKPGASCYSILMGVKNNRLYTSVKFSDLDKLQQVGEINYNHWKIYTEKMLWYYSDSKTLEVQDKQGYVIFSLKYGEEFKANIVTISGYFINPESITILAYNKDQAKRIDTCISRSLPDWKLLSEKLIYRIEPGLSSDKRK